MTYYRRYRAHRFKTAAQNTIDQAQEVIAEMEAQGYVLTLRQLYYQFVSRNWIANEEREYKRLGRIMADAREDGQVSWTAIEDRGRNCYGPNPEEDPAKVVDGIEHGLVFDLWARQDDYVEVWVEKSALEGVVARPCDKLHVPYMACKGYLSTSEAWRAGQRFREALDDGKRCTLIHLSDHDPSGFDMTRDNGERLNLFAETERVTVRRIALNMDQVEQYGPPPNPTKLTDSRAPGYVREFGTSSWELDALEPSVLDALITDTVDEYRNIDRWEEALEDQDVARRSLAALSENWGLVERFLHDQDLV